MLVLVLMWMVLLFCIDFSEASALHEASTNDDEKIESDSVNQACMENTFNCNHLSNYQMKAVCLIP